MKNWFIKFTLYLDLVLLVGLFGFTVTIGNLPIAVISVLGIICSFVSISFYRYEKQLKK